MYKYIYICIHVFMSFYGQNVCVTHGPAGTFRGKLKNVASVRILGIGEFERSSCLGVRSLT